MHAHSHARTHAHIHHTHVNVPPSQKIKWQTYQQTSKQNIISIVLGLSVCPSFVVVTLTSSFLIGFLPNFIYGLLPSNSRSSLNTVFFQSKISKKAVKIAATTSLSNLVIIIDFLPNFIYGLLLSNSRSKCSKKGYPLEAKNAPKNWNYCVQTFWARLASFCHLGLISDPLIVSKFHNESHDPKGQENKIYTIVKGKETFYRRHKVPITSCSEVKYVLKKLFFGSKECTKKLKLECANYLGQASLFWPFRPHQWPSYSF